MKLRFGIDDAAYLRIHETLDARCEEPPIGRSLAHVYLDTPEGDLAAKGVSVRFRRAAALGSPARRRPWRHETIGPKRTKTPSLEKLGVKRLKRRLGAVFDVRIERWTWRLDDGWATISLDRSRISTGHAEEAFSELRIVCRRRHEKKATAAAVELGATHRATHKLRQRGWQLFERPSSSPA